MNQENYPVRVRFAPSPTGALHIGGARTALFNYLIAHGTEGSFVLRIDDTDQERSTREFERDIIDSLNWLGLHWDEGPEVGGEFSPYRQSERTALYLEAANTLLSKNLAYRDAEGVIRLRYNVDEIIVDDLVCGTCVFPTGSLGPEVVIVRSDGNPTYHLASVVDDIQMKITHVIRGQDHLTNTAKHVLLFRGLGASAPVFVHLPLILGQDGTKLSKRNSSGMTTVTDFRQAGYLPDAVINYLMLLGWSHPEAKEHLSLSDGIAAFELERIGNTAATFDLSRLNWLNGWWIRHLPWERIAESIVPFIGEYQAIWQACSAGHKEQITKFISAEINFLTEVGRIFEILFSMTLKYTEAAQARLGEEKFSVGMREVFIAWLELLGNTPVSEASDRYSKEDFSSLLSALKKSVKVGKQVLFQGLRIAVIGDTSGPELGALVALIPREVLLERARAAQKL